MPAAGRVLVVPLSALHASGSVLQLNLRTPSLPQGLSLGADAAAKLVEAAAGPGDK